MSYKTIHVHNVTGIKYLYSVESYWDKEKKQSRNRQVCLGRIDESTGEVIPSERKKRDSERIVAAVSCKNTVAKSLICGPAWVLDKIVSDLELDKIVYECLGLDMGRHALSLAYFLIERGWPLSNCDGWSETHQHPYGEIITSQKTSELLKNITKNQIESFFKKWINKLTIKESFCYNITSISSYSENNSFMEWGYNRDKEELKQVNLAIIFGQDSGLPAYYRLIPGSIPDVVTLKKTLKSTTFLDQSKMTFV
ncbi:MAG: hypothetical protein LBF12_07930, partial [Christensenellaceae bacterium]|nr:hypothetical protein [Christensenellaceae bacterium]